MEAPYQVQLTVEEALQYQKFEAHLNGLKTGLVEGFQMGCQAMANHARRMKLSEIVESRKPAEPEPVHSEDNSNEQYD